MDVSALMFYFFAFLIVAMAVATVATPHPIYSALYLAGTMVLLAFVFIGLGAQFIGGVQLVVYAGAVMVLFVMVLMLFDLQREVQKVTAHFGQLLLKLGGASAIAGTLVGAITMSSPMVLTRPGSPGESAPVISTLDLSRMLFTEYLLAFEVLGLLLLVVAIGVVSVARMKGGTHAQS